jgi:hypothetical protein
MKSEFIDRKVVLVGYLATALWAETDSRGRPLEENFTIHDIGSASMMQASRDVDLFIDGSHDDCEQYVKRWGAFCLGHDLWLTRNRHGAGIWDRGSEEYLQRLTTVAHAMGSVDIIDQEGGLCFS